MIVLDETKWTEEVLCKNSLGKKPSETLSRVARYYIGKGLNTKETFYRLENFLIRCEPEASLTKWNGVLNRAMKNAIKYNPVKIDYISVCNEELNTIKRVKGVQAQRLAFTLLVLSKYWDTVNMKGGHWVNNKDSEIMRLANIKNSIAYQSSLYFALEQAGLIRFSNRIDNINVCVLFGQEGSPVLKITDLRNLGNQYMKYCGGNYIECEVCGATIKVRDQNHRGGQKYCEECASKIAAQQRISSVKKKRNILDFNSFKNVEKNDSPQTLDT